MGNLIKIANLNDVPPGQASAFEVDGRSIAVFNVNGTFYAIDDTCPHSGGPLSEGEVADGKVTCPWHSASFDLTTGEVLSPPADEAVKSYKVVVEGQDVKVEI